MTIENENRPCLKLTRFCGEEFYPINKATWKIYEDKNGNMNELWLEVRADFGIVLHEDTKYLKAKPHWELTIRAENLNIDDLATDFRAEIPCGYDEDSDDSLANFYYCEHEPSDNNVIEILATEENRLLIRVTGETTDVNFYDGSKPKNKIFVETWFDVVKKPNA
jgi:hypothetical protein